MKQNRLFKPMSQKRRPTKRYIVQFYDCPENVGDPESVIIRLDISAPSGEEAVNKARLDLGVSATKEEALECSDFKELKK